MMGMRLTYFISRQEALVTIASAFLPFPTSRRRQTSLGIFRFKQFYVWELCFL